MKKTIPLILASVSMAIFGQLLLKTGVDKTSHKAGDAFVRIIAKVISQPYVIAGLLLYGFSAFIWLYILTKVELSFAYPFLALSYIGVLVLSSILLGESFNLYKLSGSLFIITGLLIISRGLN